MHPWEKLAHARAPDHSLIELSRRGNEYLIRAGGYDLMSSQDEVSSRALASYGCAHLGTRQNVRVLVGGLGMGFTLREALDRSSPSGIVEVAELIPAIVAWNRGVLGGLAGEPLSDPRTKLWIGDVATAIASARNHYDAILLDVDNGPDSLAHARNDALYQKPGLERVSNALLQDGVLGVWSFCDDAPFTQRLESCGFDVSLQRIAASRKGRGRHHFVWVATKNA